MVLTERLLVETVGAQQIAQAAARQRILRRELHQLAERAACLFRIARCRRPFFPRGEAQVVLTDVGAHVRSGVRAAAQATSPSATARVVVRVLVGVEHDERELGVVGKALGRAAQHGQPLGRRGCLRQKRCENFRGNALEAEGFVELLQIGSRLHAQEHEAIHGVSGLRAHPEEATPQGHAVVDGIQVIDHQHE